MADPIDGIIRERFKSQRGFEPTEEEIAAVRAKLPDLAQSQEVQRLAELVKEGAGDEMRLVNLSLGIKAAEAMFTGLIMGAPGLDAREAHRLVQEIAYPEGLKKGHFGALDIEVGGAGQGKVFHLTCDAVPVLEKYSLARELKKITRLAPDSPSDKQRLSEQVSYLLLWARYSFMELVKINLPIIQTIAEKYDTLGAGPEAYGNFSVSESTSTLRLVAPVPNSGLPEGAKRTPVGPHIGVFAR